MKLEDLTENLMGESVLVTGGSGFLGSALVRTLRAAGHARTAALGRSPRPELENAGVDYLRGDLRDADFVYRALKGRTVVFHCAAKAGVWGSWEAFRKANVVGTENVIAACRAHGVRRLIYTGSPSAACGEEDIMGIDETAPPPTTFLCPYPRSKALAERAALTANDASLRTVCVRPPLIWGPGDPHLLPRAIAKAREGRLAIVGDGTNRVDLTYIDNAVAAHLAAARALAVNPEKVGGKAYFIGDDAPVVLWDWLNRFLEAVGAPPVRRRVSYRTAYAIGAALEWIWRAARLSGEPPMTRFVAGQLARSRFFNIAAAKRDLGYSPVIDGDEAWRRTVAAFS